MEARNVKMTLETAKRWKEMGGEYEQVAVETFPELVEIKNEWSKKFIDKMIEGFYIFGASVRKIYQCDGFKDCANLFKTEKQAKSALAYAQLTQLMALPEYNGDWVPDWENDSQKKFCIVPSKENLQIEIFREYKQKICFKSMVLAERFFENNFDLLKQFNEL